jgi:hypothetical protein
MIKVGLVVGGVSLLAALIVIAVLAVNYRVTARYLQVTWFGLPIGGCGWTRSATSGPPPYFGPSIGPTRSKSGIAGSSSASGADLQEPRHHTEKSLRVPR